MVESCLRMTCEHGEDDLVFKSETIVEDMVLNISKQVVKFQEKAITNRLVAMGWEPPVPKDQYTVAQFEGKALFEYSKIELIKIIHRLALGMD